MNSSWLSEPTRSRWTRVPTTAWWPGKVAAGGETEHLSAFWDLMPTFAEAAGAKAPGASDGISFLPTLLGEKQKDKHEYLYWEFHERGGKQAVRKGKWKAIRLDVQKDRKAPLELYNLARDIGEKNDLAAKMPEKARQLQQQLAEWRGRVGARMPTPNPQHDPQRADQWWSRRTDQPLDVKKMAEQYRSQSGK